MATVIDLKNVSVRRGTTKILDDISWTVDESDRWIVIGPNGAGKSTLIAVVSAHLFPTSGTVEILDETMGKVDVFELRPRIGVSSTLLSNRVPDGEKALDVVVSATYGMVGKWREEYYEMDYDRALDLMALMRVEHLAERRFGTLSGGEKKRVLVARSLMSDPELLLLDEPASGLDLAGREILVSALTELCLDDFSPGIVLVTHHVEEIPQGITHAMLMNDGKISAAGKIEDVMTDENLTACFGLPLKVGRSGERWTAFSA